MGRDRPASPGRILVVEDEPLVARGISQWILLGGWVVRSTGSVKSSLAALSEPFDGAVVDLGLPDGSGFDIIEVARAHQHDLPVLVLTGGHDPENVNRAHRMGVEYVCKPASAENLQCFLEHCRTPSRKRADGSSGAAGASCDPKESREQCGPELGKLASDVAGTLPAPTRAGNLTGSLARTLHENAKLATSNSAVRTFIGDYAKAKTADVFAFYEMARAAAAVDREGALAGTAALIGLHVRTLRSYALVGRFIRPNEVRELS